MNTPFQLANVQQIEARLRERLQTTQLEVIDESGFHAGHAGASGEGYGTHFRVRLGSPLFLGKTKVQQHRLVYDSLQTFLSQGLHALAIEIVCA